MDNSTKGLETQKTGDRYDDGEEIDRLKAETERLKSSLEFWQQRENEYLAEIDRLRAQNARLRFAVLFAFGWAAAEKGARESLW